MLVFALVVALGWLPVLIRFFRSWRERANPISLAICVLISVALYLPVYGAATLEPLWPRATISVLSAVACGTFYAAFWWAKKRFLNSRS